MGSADRAVTEDAPLVTLTCTCWPQAAGPVTQTASRLPARAAAAIGPWVQAAPPVTARQVQPAASARPGRAWCRCDPCHRCDVCQPPIIAVPGGSEMNALSWEVAAGPVLVRPKTTTAMCPDHQVPETLI